MRRERVQGSWFRVQQGGRQRLAAGLARRSVARQFVVCGIALLAALSTTAARANDPAPAKPAIAATVNGSPITVGEVDRTLVAALGSQQVEGEQRERLRAETLARLVDQRIVGGYLQRTKYAASSGDVQTEIDRLQQRLAQRDLKLPDYLATTGQTSAELRAEVAWRLVWQNFLEAALAEDRLQAWFNARPQDYDGREVRVRHVLLRDTEGERDTAALTKHAEEIRHRIEAGELTFEEAVKQYSAGPSAARGGDLGLIKRHEPMPEEFSVAAFALQPGGLSQPVVTRFGVHLIRVDEIVPGKRTVSDAYDQLRSDISQHWFRTLADRARPTAKVELTGAIPQPEAVK